MANPVAAPDPAAQSAAGSRDDKVVDVDGSFELSSARLRLRRLRTEDAAGVCAYRSLAEVAQYQSWESFAIGDAQRLIAEQHAVVPGTIGTWLQLALTTLESGEIVGDCGIHFVDEDQVELGITLAPKYQGLGLGAEAVEAVLGCLFETLGKHRVWAITDVENHAAARLFRRLGFRQEAHFVEHVWFKGRWSSEYAFAILRHEWVQCSRPTERNR